MALCGACSASEQDVANDESGFCGACGKDDWIEWEDFFIIPGTTRGTLGKDYWKRKLQVTNSPSIIDLMVKVLHSEAEHYSLNEGIKWIFERSISPDILELKGQT